MDIDSINSMKTYIIEWYNKTKNGTLRDYRKVVQTDDIESYVKDKISNWMPGWESNPIHRLQRACGFRDRRHSRMHPGKHLILIFIYY